MIKSNLLDVVGLVALKNKLVKCKIRFRFSIVGVI